jgi:hypothetical protein
MPDVGIRVGWQYRHGNKRVPDPVDISMCDLAAAHIVKIQITQLDSKNRGLQLGQAAVDPGEFVMVFRPRTVVSEAPDAFCEARVVRNHASGVAKRTKILGRIEAEPGGVTEGAAPP